VRELPDLPMEMELIENDVLFIKCGSVTYRLNGVSPEEFPEMPVFEGSKELTIEKAVLKELLEKTSFAVSTDQTRYVLTGVLMDITERSIRTVATDGRRLSFGRTDFEEEISFSERVIIPDKTVRELEKLIGGDGEVVISFAENQLSFKFDEINLVSRLIEGNFPDYESVIPKGYKNRIVIGTEEFMRTIRRTAVVTSQRSNMVRFILGGDTLTVTCSTPEVGEAREEVEVEYEGENLEIGFNPDYILDVLKHIDEERVVVELKDEVNPGVLRPVEDERFIYIVMRVKLEKMERVKEIIERLFLNEKYRRYADIAKIWKVWNERFGGSHGRWASLVDFRDGRLIVKVEQAVYMHGISFYKESIRRELNDAIGREIVKEVVLRRG